MKKILKCALLAGILLGMSHGSMASSSSDITKVAKEASLLAVESLGVPVVDITSGPAHIVVMAMQEFLRPKTVDEQELKETIRPRLSVVTKKMKKNSDAEGEGESDGESTNSDEGKKDEEVKIDAKLSKIKIKTKEVIEPISEGIVGSGVDDIIVTQGGTTSEDLVNDQQKKYASSAGTLDTQSLYELQRKYNEQEQAVQMIAYAVTVRQNVGDTIEKLVEKVQKNYDDSGDGTSDDESGEGEASEDESNDKKECDNGCVKKDLDPKNKQPKVHKNADYNQVLRQYAYYSLVYDQLLSLEQQIIGLRMQAKGALSEQKSDVLNDVIEMEQ